MANLCKPDSTKNKKRLGKVKSGNGLSDQEKLLNEFARKADLSIEDAGRIVAGNTAGLSSDKVAAFGAAVADEYGDMDTFAVVYESMTIE